MKYIEVAFTVTPDEELAKDVLSSLLSDIGFDSFVYETGGMKAYVPKDAWSEDALGQALRGFPLDGVDLSWQAEEAEDKDWNEVWEKNFFSPIVIGDKCVVHSTFHKDVPKAEYDILINPQMAFGTGHHETTSLMMEYILENDMSGKCVLDMGCGTSILAILASKRGAAEIDAIDIDSWCVDNSAANATLNGVDNMQVQQGDASLLSGRKPYDVILANINRNVLTADMPSYSACMKDGAVMFLSGFYTEDVECIKASAAANGLEFVSRKEKHNWASVMLRKQA
jgi:ribosomal protein L11 methyltransferase